MKYILVKFYTLSFFIFTLIGCTGEGGFSGFFNKPDKTTQFTPGDYHMPEKLLFTAETVGFLYDNFYPIGWSADGKFAYLKQIADEACGCTWMQFVIYDTQNQDEIVLKDFNDHGAGETPESIWTKLYPEIKAQLNANKVVQFSKFEIHSNKFGTNNINYEVLMQTERFADPEYSIEFVKKTSFELNSRLAGKQKITEIKYKEPYYVLDATLSGLLLSPNGLYACILYKEEKIGYEGPPHVIGISIFGIVF